jgi:hypothetical protein
MIAMDNERTYRLVRVALAETRRAERAANVDDLEHALIALDGIDQYGNTAHEQLRDEIKARFATGIRRASRDEYGNAGYEVYTNRDIEVAIDQGYAETFLTHDYRRIVEALAALFIAPDMRFDFVVQGEADDVVADDVGQLIANWREVGGALQALLRADRISVGLGSAAVYVRWHEGGPRYQAVPPQSVCAVFGDRVESDGMMRVVDTCDIDDASAVILRLPDYRQDLYSQAEPRYLAYVGRATDAPLGRLVIWAQRYIGDGPEVPRIGSSSIIEEYTIAGEPANPLTWAQESLGAEVVTTEYPVIILRGRDIGQDGGLLPTSGLGLWRDVTEMDIAHSRVLSAAVEGARGLFVLESPISGGAPLPTSLTGAVAAHEGANISKIGHEAASAAEAAMRVLTELRACAANAHCVPAYQVVDTGTKAPQSGYALDVQNAPLLAARQERIALNRGAVTRLFDIERGLAAAHMDGPPPIAADVRQRWTPGTVARPIDPIEKIDTLVRARDAGAIDQIDVVREWHDLSTDAEAIAIMARMAARVGTPGAQQKQATTAASGGLRGLAAPPPRQPRNKSTDKEE